MRTAVWSLAFLASVAPALAAPGWGNPAQGKNKAAVEKEVQNIEAEIKKLEAEAARLRKEESVWGQPNRGAGNRPGHHSSQHAKAPKLSPRPAAQHQPSRAGSPPVDGGYHPSAKASHLTTSVSVASSASLTPIKGALSLSAVDVSPVSTSSQSESTTVTDVIATYTTTRPSSSVVTSGGLTSTHSVVTVSTVTSTLPSGATDADKPVTATSAPIASFSDISLTGSNTAVPYGSWTPAGYSSTPSSSAASTSSSDIVSAETPAELNKPITASSIQIASFSETSLTGSITAVPYGSYTPSGYTAGPVSSSIGVSAATSAESNEPITASSVRIASFSETSLTGSITNVPYGSWTPSGYTAGPSSGSEVAPVSSSSSAPGSVSIADVTTTYTTTQPTSSIITSGDQTTTSSFTTELTITSTLQSAVTVSAGESPSGSSEVAPVSSSSALSSVSIADITTTYTTTQPTSSVITSGDQTTTSSCTTELTITSTLQSAVTASASATSSPPVSATAPSNISSIASSSSSAPSASMSLDFSSSAPVAPVTGASSSAAPSSSGPAPPAYGGADSSSVSVLTVPDSLSSISPVIESSSSSSSTSGSSSSAPSTSPASSSAGSSSQVSSTSQPASTGSTSSPVNGVSNSSSTASPSAPVTTSSSNSSVVSSSSQLVYNSSISSAPSGPVTTGYTTYSTLCTETANGTVYTTVHTHSAPLVSASSAPTYSGNSSDVVGPTGSGSVSSGSATSGQSTASTSSPAVLSTTSSSSGASSSLAGPITTGYTTYSTLCTETANGTIFTTVHTHSAPLISGSTFPTYSGNASAVVGPTGSGSVFSTGSRGTAPASSSAAPFATGSSSGASSSPAGIVSSPSASGPIHGNSGNSSSQVGPTGTGPTLASSAITIGRITTGVSSGTIYSISGNSSSPLGPTGTGSTSASSAITIGPIATGVSSGTSYSNSRNSSSPVGATGTGLTSASSAITIGPITTGVSSASETSYTTYTTLCTESANGTSYTTVHTHSAPITFANSNATLTVSGSGSLGTGSVPAARVNTTSPVTSSNATLTASGSSLIGTGSIFASVNATSSVGSISAGASFSASISANVSSPSGSAPVTGVSTTTGAIGTGASSSMSISANASSPYASSAPITTSPATVGPITTGASSGVSIPINVTSTYPGGSTFVWPSYTVVPFPSRTRTNSSTVVTSGISSGISASANATTATVVTVPTSSANGTAVINRINSTSSAAPTSTGCVPCRGQPGFGTDQPFCGFTAKDNSYEVMPITCKTVKYDFTITNTTLVPDGVERLVLAVNGQMPGPLIEANWGDTIEVTVRNALTNNGTVMHWHGMRQNYTNEMDGVASITQCPIAPGDSMTYTFKASNYGTSWYHSHYAIQTYEGVFGPMIIHGPHSDDSYDEEEMIVLQDWNHIPVDALLDKAQSVAAGGPTTLDTGLINGMNVWKGAGKRYEMTVTSGNTYLIRLVNVAIQSTFKFYIDGHKMKVIGMDYVPLVPYETTILNINPGQRYDVLVTFDQTVGDYWMRSDNQQVCSSLTNSNDIKAMVHYSGGPMGTPASTAYTYTSECIDEPYGKLVPYAPMDAGEEDAEIAENVVIGAVNNLFKWSLNGVTFFADWNDPTLYSIYNNGTVPDYSGNLAIEVPNLNEWVYVIIESPIPSPHPIHLHGHDFLVLAQGLGSYTSSTALNLKNPPRRDVAILPGNAATRQSGYLVIAWKTDNPGAWLLHCHIGWHAAMGFALQIIENLDGIKDTVKQPANLNDNCASYNAYAAQNGIGTADSGI